MNVKMRGLYTAARVETRPVPWIKTPPPAPDPQHIVPEN